MKTRSIGLIVAISLALAFSITVPGSVQAGPVKLTYSCFFPPTHVQSQLA